MTDEEIIQKLKITPKTKVLDMGGSLKQHPEISVDTLVDMYPPEIAPYWPSKLLAKHFVKADIMRQNLPFKDKEFDVVLCTHVVEDLFNPFLILEEMSRVAKKGLIVTPTRGKDMEFSGFNLTDWKTGPRRQPGHSHHHWFIENLDNKLILTPKIYPLLYTREFQVTKWKGEEECQYFWEGKINYEVFGQVDTHALIENYRQFMRANKDILETGAILFYVDNPFRVLREVGKRCYQLLSSHF
jgi:hypothetical protein